MDAKTTIAYLVIAIVIVAVVAFVVSRATSKSYSVFVSIAAELPSNSYPFQTLSFKVLVNNTGHSGISSMPVVLYLNGNPIDTYKVTIPAGQSAGINESYIYPSNGTYQFEAVADPGQLLDIVDRQHAESTLTVNVSAEQVPRPFSSIPNNGFGSATGFSFFGNGTSVSYLLADQYGIGMFNYTMGPANSILSAVLGDLAGTINIAEGALVPYNAGGTGYSIWLQGTLTPKLVSDIVSSFSLNAKPIEANGSDATIAAINSTTSLCTFYSGGWTKIVVYQNTTGGTSCAGVVTKLYNGTAQADASAAYNSSTALRKYNSEFFYRNSSYLGGIISYNRKQLETSNLFQNQYGYFVSYIARNAEPVNISSFNESCPGIIYSNGTADICSSYVQARSAATNGYDMINETEVTSNYTVSLFSLVAAGNVIIANQNGVNLIKALNVSESPARWSSKYRNSCLIYNASLKCSFVSFNYSADTAVLNITNALAGRVIINSVSCYAPGERHNESVNYTVPEGSSADVGLLCYTIPTAPVGITSSYSISIGYFYNGSERSTSGVLNITNIGLGG
jgi:hypothetical protein